MFLFFIFSEILICPSQMPLNMMNQLVPEPTNKESLRRAWVYWVPGDLYRSKWPYNFDKFWDIPDVYIWIGLAFLTLKRMWCVNYILTLFICIIRWFYRINFLQKRYFLLNIGYNLIEEWDWIIVSILLNTYGETATSGLYLMVTVQHFKIFACRPDQTIPDSDS